MKGSALSTKAEQTHIHLSNPIPGYRHPTEMYIYVPPNQKYNGQKKKKKKKPQPQPPRCSIVESINCGIVTWLGRDLLYSQI